MATYAPTTTSAHPEERAATPVLDRELSKRLDKIIAQLDEERRPLRRAWLRARKAWLEELHVPVCGKGVQR